MAKSKRTDIGEESIQRAEAMQGTEFVHHDPPFADAYADRERVAQRAYELYLARGGADGHAMEDWLNAERELIR